MPRKKDYSAWSKQDLIQRIHALEKRKKYGLVWDAEHTPEEFEKEAKDALPVLKAVPDKAIHSSPDDPTHILIEGDNFHALSALNYTHEKAVDVIYIDPPYNTGNQDFRYNDKFVEKEDAYRHSKWLSFMDKRLRLAKNLLKDTGVIFISIDDNEMAQLKILCDEIFGEANFVANIIWQKKFSRQSDARFLSSTTEYILTYAKSIGNFEINLLPRTEKQDNRYKNVDNDPRGPWSPDNMVVKTYSAKYDYPIKTPTGRVVNPARGFCWRFSKEKFEELVADNRIWFGATGNNIPRLKRFLSEVQQGLVPVTLWDRDFAGDTQEGVREVKEIVTEAKFDNPKPVKLLLRILEISTFKESDATVLDFFAGSGTTAHAVAEINKQDGGKRRAILCTNNENEIAAKICYPRTRRVIKGYKSESGNKIAGLGGNLNYYRTAFVPAAPTDANKEMLTLRSVEMLCLRENTFEFVRENAVWKIFKNQARYTAILFDNLAIPKFKKELAKLDLPISVYIFSLGDETFDDEFEDLADRVSVRAIPEAILRVYRRIYM